VEIALRRGNGARARSLNPASGINMTRDDRKGRHTKATARDSDNIELRFPHNARSRGRARHCGSPQLAADH
jgi:hypothetical protein